MEPVVQMDVEEIKKKASTAKKIDLIMKNQDRVYGGYVFSFNENGSKVIIGVRIGGEKPDKHDACVHFDLDEALSIKVLEE